MRDLFGLDEVYHPGVIHTSIVRAEATGKDLVIAIDLRNRSNEERRAWSVRCVDVCDHWIRLGPSDGSPELVVNHPLLWPHATPRVSLYFNGRVSRLSEMKGELFAKHYELVGDWMPFGRHLNGPITERLFSCGSGMLAEGPAPLIEGYQRVVTRFGLRTSMFPPGRRTGWRSTPERTVVAMICGTSWVVAKQITAESSHVRSVTAVVDERHAYGESAEGTAPD